MRNSVIKKNRKVYIFKHQQTSSGGGGGGADLEDNKTATIDVSAYTNPVEITPTQGKDGMKKVTVSLSNMPAGANMLYAWAEKTSHEVIFTNFNIAPQEIRADDTEHKCIVSLQNEINELTMSQYIGTGYSCGKINDNEFYIEDVDTLETEQEFVRDPTKDIEIWNAPPEVENTKQATIDVSAYNPSNKPVITPTTGKQSMGSVEVTLSNIPSGGGVTLYAWASSSNNLHYFNFSSTEGINNANDFKLKHILNTSSPIIQYPTTLQYFGNMQTDGYAPISDTQFKIGGGVTYERANSSYDLQILS